MILNDYDYFINKNPVIVKTPTYIALIAPLYRTIVVYYYLLLVTDLLILNTLTSYLEAAYTILDLSESY